jgi:peptidoglycan/xylan/chitin deacetylase (PgdA/CDA1 family)
MNSIKEALLKKVISSSNQRLIVPFYHKVSNEKQTFENYLYKARKVQDFKNDLAVLNKYYSSISMQQFIDITKSKRNLNKNYFHVTFDDGLSNFYKVVAPILLERKISATVFINSDFVDNKGLFYRYKASLLVQNYEKSSQKEKNKYHNFFDKNYDIKESLFSINFNNKEVLDALSTEVNYNFDEYLATEKPYLTTTQIEDLIEMGFTIGAHSKSHPLFTDIDLQAQLDQTKECLIWLIEKFNIDYKVFSFPFTDLNVSSCFFKEISKDFFLNASFGTSGIKKDTIKTNFQRIPFEIENEKAESYLLKEYVKYFLKIPFQKNIMPRK